MPDQVAPREFGVRFQEAVDYLKGKLPEASLAWDDLAGPVHAKVFTVAGATKVDLVRDLHDAVTKALEQGTTLAGFRKDFDQAVQRYGWSYNGTRGWRTAIIYNTNMRSAHMAGRWAQIQANKKDRPYLQYRTAGDARVRPLHRQWNGLIYPVDDAFWRTHYPPNGWGCRCTVRSYSVGDLQTRNLQVSEPFKLVTRDVVDAGGDFKDRVPVGIDPGWDHNVGQSWISPELALGQKLASLPPELRGRLTDKTISSAFQQAISENWKAFQTAVKATPMRRNDAQVLGFLDSATVDSLAARVPELALESTAVAVFDKQVTHLTGGHKAATAPQQVWPQAMIDELPMILRGYRAVLWDQLDAALVVVPAQQLPDSAPGRFAKVVMRPNFRSKFGRALAIVSLGSSDQGNLADTNRYRLLVGRLK